VLVVLVATVVLLLAGCASAGGTTAAPSAASSAPTSAPASAAAITSPPSPTVAVTADEIAAAMQEDRFFTDYGQALLVVRGTVKSVDEQGNDQLIELGTNLTTSVLCVVGSRSVHVRVGESLSVTARAQDAQRQRSAVMLQGCRIQQP